MTFNFYFTIEAKINKTYNVIYDGQYINYTQVVNTYNILLYQL